MAGNETDSASYPLAGSPSDNDISELHCAQVDLSKWDFLAKETQSFHQTDILGGISMTNEEVCWLLLAQGSSRRCLSHQLII